MERPKKIFLVIAAGLILMGVFNLIAIPDVSSKHPAFMTIPRLLAVNVPGFVLLAILAFTAFIRLVRYNRAQRWANFYRNMGSEFQRGQDEAARSQGGNSGGQPKSDAKASFSEDEVKDLYRELLKKYHPDFARSEEDKKFRTELTAKINKAYKEGDVEMLRLFR